MSVNGEQQNHVTLAHLVLFKTILEDVLDHEAASLAQGNLVPHTLQSLIDVRHDLRRRLGPTQLEQLLPDMARVAVDDSVGDSSK